MKEMLHLSWSEAKLLFKREIGSHLRKYLVLFLSKNVLIKYVYSSNLC